MWYILERISSALVLWGLVEWWIWSFKRAR